MMHQITSLDDVKSSSQVDGNAQKSMALDHLGVIAGRLRQCMLKNGRAGSGDKNVATESNLRTMEEVRFAFSLSIFAPLINIIRSRKRVI